jgi:hypothetical protein
MEPSFVAVLLFFLFFAIFFLGVACGYASGRTATRDDAANVGAGWWEVEDKKSGKVAWKWREGPLCERIRNNPNR